MKPIVLAIALAAFVSSALAADNTSSRLYNTSKTPSVPQVACGIGACLNSDPYTWLSEVRLGEVRLGEVLMVREIQLKSDKKVNAGSAIGAAVGYGAARKVDGNYRSAARVAGGVIGGVAGTAIQNGFSGRRAVEIYVRDVSDKRQRVIAIVQDADSDVRQGDQVFLVGKGSKTRVVPIPRTTITSDSGGDGPPKVACGLGGCSNSEAEDGPWNGTTRSSLGQDSCGLMCPDGYELAQGCSCAKAWR
ncbi:hypothetical protein ACO0J1_07125 [Stenotrophomonas acidaminiphila]|uniref:hypothetical protein n=1 Tax=Stenotrophomonas acidaminiphila TaxID=128780 RepID=UPI003BF12B0B